MKIKSRISIQVLIAMILASISTVLSVILAGVSFLAPHPLLELITTSTVYLSLFYILWLTKRSGGISIKTLIVFDEIPPWIMKTIYIAILVITFLTFGNYLSALWGTLYLKLPFKMQDILWDVPPTYFISGAIFIGVFLLFTKTKTKSYDGKI